MGHNTPKHTIHPWQVSVGFLIAAAIGGSLALLNIHYDDQEQEWVECFDQDLQSALTMGVDLEFALTAVHDELATDQRRLSAHQRALHQLQRDARWDDPEQWRWLEMAEQQTQQTIDVLQDDIEVTEDTAGCLEQY